MNRLRQRSVAIIISAVIVFISFAVMIVREDNVDVAIIEYVPATSAIVQLTPTSPRPAANPTPAPMVAGGRLVEYSSFALYVSEGTSAYPFDIGLFIQLPDDKSAIMITEWISDDYYEVDAALHFELMAHELASDFEYVEFGDFEHTEINNRAAFTADARFVNGNEYVYHGDQLLRFFAFYTDTNIYIAVFLGPESYYLNSEKYALTIINSIHSIKLRIEDAYEEIYYETLQDPERPITASPSDGVVTLGSSFYFDNMYVEIGTEIGWTTVNRQWSDRHGLQAFYIPVTVTNMHNVSHRLSSFRVTFFGPDGLRLDEMSFYFDSDIFNGRNDMRPGATMHSYIHILYDGEGEYVIEFSERNNLVEVIFNLQR